MLASCQSLIKFIRDEMGAYRLYTVVPRLLKLVDTLTNWYVRFNRKRLKVSVLNVACLLHHDSLLYVILQGENGVEDATQAMNTLFEVLLTLCLTMVCEDG